MLASAYITIGGAAIIQTSDNAAAAGQQASAAQASANTAAAAAAAAVAAGGPSYASTAAGLAATTNGQAFAVNVAGAVSIYLNSSGSAVLQRTLPTSAALGAVTGGQLVGHKGPGANEKTRDVYQVGNSWVTSERWLNGGSDMTDAANFRNMLTDLAAIGSPNLYVKAGSYRLTSKIPITSKIDMTFDPNAAVAMDFGTNITDYLFEIAIADGGITENRGMRISGLHAFVGYGADSSHGGGGIIRLRNDGGNVSNHVTVIEKCQLAGPDLGGTPSSAFRFAIRVDGTSFATNIQDNSSIYGGIGLFGVDGAQIVHNEYGGNSCFVYIELSAPGAFKQLIAHNVGQSRDGFLYAIQGSQVDLLENQIEQAAATNTSTYGAQVTLLGNGTANVLRSWAIRNNNFGGGSNTQVPLHVQANVEELLIDENNVFNPGSSGYDIRLASATVKNTRLPRRPMLRGTRGTDPKQWTATGSISVNTLTITAVASGVIQLGDTVAGAGVTPCTVNSFGSGTGGTGTYTVSGSQTVASTTLSSSRPLDPTRWEMVGSATGSVLTITTATRGNINVGDTISGVNLYNDTIVSFGTGTGGVGTYNLTGAHTQGSGTTTVKGTNANGIAWPVNGADTTRLLSLLDAGVGTYNSFKYAADFSPTGLQGSWTAGSGFIFWKNDDCELCWDGTMTAGTVTAGTLVATLPLGFRPASSQIISAPNSVDGTSAQFNVATNGQITVKVCPASAAVYLGSASRIPIMGTSDYTPGI